jgi:hypothetical protein
MDTQHMFEMASAVTIAVITTLIGPAVVEYIKSKLASTPVDPIKKELQYSCIINDELESIREDMDADRCWITMFHNGGHYLHGNKSVQKFSVMFETSAPGVAGVGMIFNNIPVSLFSKSVDEMIKSKHIYISDYSDPTVATFGLKEAATASGTRSSYSIGLFDLITDQCIGTIGIDYLDKTKLNAAQLILLNEKSQRVAGFLSNFIRSK